MSDPIHDAARAGDVAQITALLQSGVSINATTDKKYTALHVAVSEGQLDTVALLIEKKADLNAAAEDGVRAIQIAASSGRPKIAQLLLNHNVLLTPNAAGLTPYCIAAAAGKPETVKVFSRADRYENSDDVPWRNYGEESKQSCDALEEALKNGHEALMRPLFGTALQISSKVILAAIERNDVSLLERLVNEKTWLRAPVLQILQTPGKKDLATRLLALSPRIDAYELIAEVHAKNPSLLISWMERKPILEYWRPAYTPTESETTEDQLRTLIVLDKNPRSSKSALLRRAAQGHRSVGFAQFLLAQGVSPNSKDGYGNIPLLWAAQGNPEMVKLLLRNRSNVQATSDRGNTALHRAVGGDVAGIVIAKLLLDAGVSVTAKNELGNTAIHMAARRGRDDLVSLLITRGADVTVENTVGTTPLHFAAASGAAPRTAMLLLDANANVNAKDKTGISPLHLAMATPNIDLVKLLLSRKADPKATDAMGNTVLHAAVIASPEDDLPVAECLSKPELRCPQKLDPAGRAFDLSEESYAVMRLLIAAGADPRAKNKAGRSAIDMALITRNFDLMNRLRTKR